MRILLLNPPRRDIFISPLSRTQPVGLAYLAAYIREKEPQHRVRIFDSLAYLEESQIIKPEDMTPVEKRILDNHPIFDVIGHFGASYETIEKVVKLYKPDFVGMSTLMSQYSQEAHAVARIVKENSDAKTMIGGAHAAVSPAEALKDANLDYVCIGEGEITFHQLVNALENNGGDLSGVEGLVYKAHDGSLKTNPPRSLIDDIDTIPLPALDLLPMEKYFSNCGKRLTTLTTSRGCPFRCTFCGVFLAWGRTWRPRKPAHVVEEILLDNKKYGITHFNIEDDNFTLNIKRAEEICDLIIESGVDITLAAPNGVAAYSVSRDLLEKMQKAGFKAITLGLESMDKQALMNMKKPTTLEKSKNAIQWSHEAGIEMINGFVILGMPDQDIGTMKRSIKALMQLNVTPQPNTFYPIPATQAYKDCIAAGHLEGEIPYEDYGWLRQSNIPMAVKDRFTREDIFNLYVSTYLTGYLRKKLHAPLWTLDAVARFGNTFKWKYMWKIGRKLIGSDGMSNLVKSLVVNVNSNIQFAGNYQDVYVKDEGILRQFGEEEAVPSPEERLAPVAVAAPG